MNSKIIHGFTVTAEEIKDSKFKPVIKAALKRGIHPVFRFDRALDNSFTSQKSSTLVDSLLDASTKFQNKFNVDLSSALIPFTATDSENLEKRLVKLGFKTVKNKLNLNPSNNQMLDVVDRKDDGSTACLVLRDIPDFTNVVILMNAIKPYASIPLVKPKSKLKKASKPKKKRSSKKFKKRRAAKQRQLLLTQLVTLLADPV